LISFNLLTNYIEDLEALIRRTKAKLKKVSTLESEDNQTRRILTLDLKPWLTRLHDFSAPTTTNIRTRPKTNVGGNGFEFKLALINTVQPS
jgi:hypothetical protein